MEQFVYGTLQMPLRIKHFYSRPVSSTLETRCHQVTSTACCWVVCHGTLPANCLLPPWTTWSTSGNWLVCLGWLEVDLGRFYLYQLPLNQRGKVTVWLVSLQVSGSTWTADFAESKQYKPSQTRILAVAFSCLSHWCRLSDVTCRCILLWQYLVDLTVLLDVTYMLILPHVNSCITVSLSPVFYFTCQ